MWSFPYPTPSGHPPFFGQPGSHIFCEEDYVWTHYIAEFFNTITSALYIVYGIYGIRRFKNENTGLFSSANLPYFGLIGVGIASSLYHASLQYYTQMADEMAMHTAMGCILIQLWTWRQPKKIARRNSAIIVVSLTSFIVYHVVTDEFVLHVIIFFLLCVSVGWKTRRIINEKITDANHRAKLGGLATSATCTALFAYFLWNIDVHFCSTLTRWKHQVGLPWGILLEFHGIWHILTTFSTYMFMSMIEYLTTDEHEDTIAKGFKWPSKSVLESLLPNRASEDSLHANGHVKGQANGSVRKRQA